MNRPIELTGLAGSLAINANRTLKVLELSIPVIGDQYDPLCGLSRELEYIAGNNILEELVLHVVVRDDACKTRSEDWSAFDSVLTKSDAFPILHRVSVEIWWHTACKDLEDYDTVLKSLEEVKSKFPRLVESEAVEFKFSSKIRYQDSCW